MKPIRDATSCYTDEPPGRSLERAVAVVLGSGTCPSHLVEEISARIVAMPNLAQVFKGEIARIARRQSRTELEALKRFIARRHRSDIASLKRQMVALTRQLAAVGKRRAAVAEPAPPPGALRFRAKGLASHRKRLGLSAAELGLLLGVSGQSVYLWEAGRARPRANHMPAIAALRGLGRRQAAAVVASRRLD